MTTPILNLADAELTEFASPSGKFSAKLARLGPLLGCEKLGAMLTVLEPGKAAFPFHAHHAIEELFVILEGEGTYRHGDHEHAIKAGDVIAAPAGGADTAHQVVNTGAAPLKLLAISTMDAVDIVEYPDSGTVRLYDRGAGDAPRLNHVAKKGDAVDLHEAEEGES